MDLKTETISAAGAVLWRHENPEEISIALIHRPQYDDWSFPKGKVQAGESQIACAHREVLEETGVDAKFGPELGETSYEVEGVRKVVKYWGAEASDGEVGIPDPAEVDAVEWLPVAQAQERLTWEYDKAILNSFLEFGPDTVPLVLLRHAKALNRADWSNDDGDRPLDALGQQQAKRLLTNYLPYHLEEIHSSDAMRCIETVEPFARARNLHIVIAEDLGEYRNFSHKDAAYDYVQEIIESGVAALACGHNPILPLVVRKLIGKKPFQELDARLNPAEAWVLHHREGQIVAIDWMASPNV